MSLTQSTKGAKLQLARKMHIRLQQGIYVPRQTNKTSLFSRVSQYIAALDNAGRILTIIGVLPTLIDFGAKIAGYEIPVPAWTYSLWFIISFGIANIRIFEARADEGLDIHIQKHNVSLKKWLSVSDQKFSIDSRICFAISGILSISNMGAAPTHVRIGLTSVDSELQPSVDPETIKLHVDRIISRGDARTGNPFSLGPHEMNDHVQFQGEIPVLIPDSVDPFAFLGSISKISIELSFERAGRKTITRHLPGDVHVIRADIERNIVEKVQHSQRDNDIPNQMLQTLKRYWSVTE